MPAAALPALCAQLRDVLAGPMRADIVSTLASRHSLREALASLRHMMRSHVWSVGGRSVPLTAAVLAADAATRREGFHALHDWDGIADHVNPEVIPVDVLDYIRALRPDRRAAAAPLALLIDYYFFHILSLMSLRIWDVTDPPEALRTIGDLLDALQGPDGSGQPFVADAETLLLIATSHYEPDERGYGLLLDRVAGLDQPQRHAIALGHAASLGAHLRFGFLATYGRQTSEMRDDNVADYPWLRWSVATVLNALKDEHEAPRRLRLTEALLGGLTADTEALIADPVFAAALRPMLPSLLPAFANLEPTPDVYSPLAFFFNFSHNLLKGTMIDAVLREECWTVSYSDLLTGRSGGCSPLASREALARTLMEYARRSPQRIRGELLPVVVYDPVAGHACHAATMATLHRFVQS